MERDVVEGFLSKRAWLALMVLLIAFFFQGSMEELIYQPIAQFAGLHMIQSGEMEAVPYGMLMIFRLCWDLALVCIICAALGHRLVGAPLFSPKAAQTFAVGLAIGLLVMIAAIVTIILTGNATASISVQPIEAAVGNGGAWLVFDIIGATGEELFGRVALLIVVERFLGWKGAAFISGLMFAAIHLGNPGATPIWITRLGLQGVLLAYAVYRIRSVWWSVGYHAGWNWACAPLFGAAGSGYLDRGHLLEFTKTGPDWMTGGAVGPEGSVLAIAAMIVALGLMLAVTPRRLGGDNIRMLSTAP